MTFTEQQLCATAARAASIAAEVTNWSESIDHLEALSDLDSTDLEKSDWPEDAERMEDLIEDASPATLIIARVILSHNHCIAIGRA